MIEDYEDLDDLYDAPKVEKIKKPGSPVGSRTDNARDQEPKKNSAHKRLKRIRETMDNFYHR